MAICYLGIGSNLYDRQRIIKETVYEINKISGVKLLEQSSVIETEPYGVLDQPLFLNTVVAIATELHPENLLIQTQQIERKFGRERTVRWGPRVIDIDLLLYGNTFYYSENLEIPHRELHKRRFVLISLNELCPNLIHPKFGVSINQLFSDLQD